VLCAERVDKLSGGQQSVVWCGKGEIERWAIVLCCEGGEELRGER